MKELVNILYGEEIKEFKAYTRKQKAVHIYVVVSLCLVYNRSTKKYEAYKFEDISDFREFKGDKKVYIDFYF